MYSRDVCHVTIEMRITTHPMLLCHSRMSKNMLQCNRCSHVGDRTSVMSHFATCHAA